MFGKIFVGALLLFLASFAVGTTAMIVKELIARKKRAASEQNKHEEKEGDQRN